MRTGLDPRNTFSGVALKEKDIPCRRNISLTNASDWFEVWAVPPSCWNHTFWRSSNSLPSSGHRKSRSMAQYRFLFTVISPFSSKKVRSNHTKIKNSKPHRYFGLMMEFPVVCFQTTNLILLVCYCKTKSKRLLGKCFKACFDTMFYGLSTQLLNQRVMT